MPRLGINCLSHWSPASQIPLVQMVTQELIYALYACGADYCTHNQEADDRQQTAYVRIERPLYGVYALSLPVKHQT